MELSMTTDYLSETGCPEPYLRRIAEAGFTHLHWCHHWRTDFLYTDPEIKQISLWLDEFGLALLNVHASAGKEKRFGSEREYERQAGVALIQNRMEMAARLSSDVVILHADQSESLESQLKSLSQLAKESHDLEVRVAIENPLNGDFSRVSKLLSEFSPDFLGLCYDSGHGNIHYDGTRELERLKDRLIAVHLHDNDGSGDQHRIPFTGTVPWSRIAELISLSAYRKCMNLELYMKSHTYSTEAEYLKAAYIAGKKLTQMIADAEK